jgi:hypothetical protein
LPLSSANAITNDSIRDRIKLRKQQAQKTYLTHMTTTESKSSPIATKAALSDLSEKGVKEISTHLRELLADVFALYVKTKNFHWHMTGPNFRDYHGCWMITVSKSLR